MAWQVVNDAVEEGDYSRAVGNAVVRLVKAFAASKGSAVAAPAGETSAAPLADARPLPYRGSMNDAVKAQVRGFVGSRSHFEDAFGLQFTIRG